MIDKYINFIIIFIGLLLASIFYSLASYSYRYIEQHKMNFMIGFFISLFFSVLSFCIKIPVLHFYAKDVSIFLINIYYMILCFFIVSLYSYLILNEKIDTHTYIIGFLIFLLIILNAKMSMSNKIKK